MFIFRCTILFIVFHHLFHSSVAHFLPPFGLFDYPLTFHLNVSVVLDLRGKTFNLSPLIIMLAMIFHNFFRPRKFPSIPSFVECFIIRSFWILYIVFFL